jgi:hypothetical protein
MKAQVTQERNRAGDHGTTSAQGHNREPLAGSLVRKAPVSAQPAHTVGRDEARGRSSDGSRRQRQ